MFGRTWSYNDWTTNRLLTTLRTATKKNNKTERYVNWMIKLALKIRPLYEIRVSMNNNRKPHFSHVHSVIWRLPNTHWPNDENMATNDVSIWNVFFQQEQFETNFILSIEKQKAGRIKQFKWKKSMGTLVQIERYFVAITQF